MRPLLLTRLTVALSLPVAGCWAVDTRSETVVGTPAPDGSCRAKGDPALVLSLPTGSRCNPKELESIDQGPVTETRPDGSVRCLYLITTSQTQRPQLCFGSGRPLQRAGVAVVAALRRGAWG